MYVKIKLISAEITKFCVV